jgi:hypothetical protein
VEQVFWKVVCSLRMSYQTQTFQEHDPSCRSDHVVSLIVCLDYKLHHLLHITQFCMPSYMILHAVLVQTLQSYFTVDSLDSSLPRRIGLLDLNESLFCIGLGPRGLCHKDMMRVGA